MIKNLWTLPESVEINGKSYPVRWDFREILQIFSYLSDPDLPEVFRWKVAMALFYREEIPLCGAVEAFGEFIRGGEAPQEKAAPKLYDWEQDRAVILAEVNKVAGRELRREKAVHWWTFLGWFHGIGEGRFSFLVGIRDKLRRGERLSDYEERFYRENQGLVELKSRYSRRDLQQKEALLKLLDGK